MNFHTHINELSWHIWRNTSSYIYSNICLHQLTTQHSYYKIKHSRGEARWSLSKPTTSHKSQHTECSLRNYQTQTQILGQGLTLIYDTVHRVHKVYRLQNTKCRVQKKRVVCKLYITIYTTYIYTIHNVHTNIHATNNIHSQRTLRHTLALPTTQAYRHDVIIKRRSPATTK